MALLLTTIPFALVACEEYFLSEKIWMKRTPDAPYREHGQLFSACAAIGAFPRVFSPKDSLEVVRRLLYDNRIEQVLVYDTGGFMIMRVSSNRLEFHREITEELPVLCFRPHLP